jgi:hypothetical protein
VKEYAADAVTVLRRTHTDFVPDTVYSDRHIIGLPSGVTVYDGGSTVFSKVKYLYDEGGASMTATSPAPSQHDETNYSSTFVQGCGLVTSFIQYDATAPADENKVTTTKMGYDQCGSMLWARDALNHQTTIDYTDSFAEGVTGRNTFAYPTKVTDGDGFFSTVTYNFDLGAVVETKGPPPAGNALGASKKTEYDDAGSVQKITNLVNLAYTRYEYSPNGLDTKTYSTITETLGEAFSAVTSDGAGRVRAF